MYKFFATAFFAFTLLFSAAGLVSAQASMDGLGNEVRPYDFSDKYYESNGISAAALIDRRNGNDGKSVFDVTNDRMYTSVRITETMPAYSGEGNAIFWTYNAAFNRDAFLNNEAGGIAVDTAYTYPLYVFPSATVKNTDRQAAMIKIDESYEQKNPIGVAAVIVVEYTSRIFTKSGRAMLQTLTDRNGNSLDGTPIIRSAKEL